MTVYIDSNTFGANPALYADAEKTKPLPRVLPAVQLREGKLNVAFLGDRAPTTDMVLSLSAVLAGTQTQILAEYGDAVDGADVPTWEFPFALNSQALADVLADKQRASLLVGVIATAEGYRREWQLLVTCDPTATGELDPEQVESVKTFADAAKRSADNAAESESNAAQSATHAAEFATASSQSASASATSASNAATSEDNAKASETNAKASETNAAQSASDAAQSKTAAANSASAAATSASNASSSASAANTSAGNASNSATAAATSANNASQSASAAKTSETNAKASETASKASETASATSATNAATSATNAKASETNAATSATNAGNSATNAAESAEQAAQSAEQAEETLQNVYTKQEVDSVLAVRDASITTNTANIAEHAAEIATLQRLTEENAANIEKVVAGTQDATMLTAVANVAKWQTSATAIQQGVDAETAMEVAVGFSRATDTYLADPTATKTWDADNQPNANGKPLVDFNVATIGSGLFGNGATSNIIFAPSSTSAIGAFSSKSFNADVYAYLPACKSIGTAFRGATVDGGIYAKVGVSVYPHNQCFENAECENIYLDADSFVGSTGGTRWFQTCKAKHITVTAPLLPKMTMAFYNAVSLESVSIDTSALKEAPQCFQATGKFNQALSLPVLSSGVDMFLNSGLSAENISKTLDSLPSWDDGESHVITFTGCPGQIATQRFEPFTVTDDDGVEYTLENCPTFDTDDENETLRKAFVLAQEKKGWTIEISEPVAQWYNYMLEKAALTGDAATANTATVERAKTELDTSGTSALAMRLYEDWLAITDQEAFYERYDGTPPFDAAFWTAYFAELSNWEANPVDVAWDADTAPYATTPPTEHEWVINFNVTVSNIGVFASGTNSPIYLPRLKRIVANSGGEMINGSSQTYNVVFPELEYKQYNARIWNTVRVPELYFHAPKFESTGSYGCFGGGWTATKKAVLSYPKLFTASTSAGLELGYTNQASTALVDATMYSPRRGTVGIDVKYSRTLGKLTYIGGLPNATLVGGLIGIASSTICETPVVLSFGDEWEGELEFPSATTATSFAKNRAGFNQAVLFPALEDGTDAFLNAGLTAENISKTLDSLPTWTDGATHTITFTGCPGAAELTQDSPSVVAAVAKGWTVEL